MTAEFTFAEVQPTRLDQGKNKKNNFKKTRRTPGASQQE